MTKILFVCLGNICRSPAAEAIFEKMVSNADLENSISCDSAGTASYHAGNPADSRMIEYAKKRGYTVTSISRQVDPEKDFPCFDYIVAMDHSNYLNLKRMLPKDSNYHKKIVRMVDFSVNLSPEQVPDPYYGGESGFKAVIDILEDSCRGLLETLTFD